MKEDSIEIARMTDSSTILGDPEEDSSEDNHVQTRNGRLDRVMTNLLAAMMLFVAMGFESLMTVCAQYVEQIGVSWYQVTLFGEWIFLLCLVIYWIAVYSLKYYYFNSRNDSYSTVLLSIFPMNNDNSNQFESWVMLVLRGICGSVSFALYMVSLVYIDSGDAVLLQNVVISVCSILLGFLLFKEKITWMLLVSLVLCVIGIICVCQPSWIMSFIFSSSNSKYEPISLIGFLFAIGSGVALLLSGLITKHSKSLQLPWLSLSLMAGIISSATATVIFLAEYYYFDLHSSSYVAMSALGYKELLILVSIGVLICLFIVLYTISYQHGHVGQLGLILNSDIVITYVLQVFILHQTKNFLAYCGVGIVMLVCLLIFINSSMIDKSASKDNNVSVKQETVTIAGESDPLLSSKI